MSQFFSFALPMHSSCDLKQLQCNHLKSDWLYYKTGIGKTIFTLQSRINVAQMVFSDNFNLVQLIFYWRNDSRESFKHIFIHYEYK